MVSKNGSKLKFSVESLLEPTVTTASKCYPETINAVVSPSIISIAGPGRQFDVMKVNAPQGITIESSPHSAINIFLF